LPTLDGDARLDPAFLNDKGLLRVIRGRDGKLLYEFDAGSVSKGRDIHSSHGPTVADMTDDGKLDIFFVVGGTYDDQQRSQAGVPHPSRSDGWGTDAGIANGEWRIQNQLSTPSSDFIRYSSFSIHPSVGSISHANSRCGAGFPAGQMTG